MAGATVFGTSRSADKAERAQRWGASLVIHVREDEQDFAATMVAANRGRPADVILDLVGGAYLARSLSALGPHGRLVFIGLISGSRAEVDLGALMRRRLHLMGSTLRTRPPQGKMALTAEFERLVLPALAAGRLRAVVDRVLPLADAAEAHRLLEADAVVGKIVLRV